MYKKIDYLDLEISQKQRNIISLDNNRLVYSFTSNYKHILHTTNPDLDICNSIIDLQIALGQSLRKNLESHNRICQSLVHYQRQKNKELREIRDLLKIALDLRQMLPSKEDILHLIDSLELHKPKPIEVEIRNLLDQTKLEIEKLEDLAKNQKSFLEELKTFLSN